MERKKTLTSNSFDFLLLFFLTLDNSNIHHWVTLNWLVRQWEKKTHSIRFDCWLTFSCKTQNNNSSFWMNERKKIPESVYLPPIFFLSLFFTLNINDFIDLTLLFLLFGCLGCWMFACFKFIKVNIIINNVPLSFNDNGQWWLVSSEDKERNCQCFIVRPKHSWNKFSILNCTGMIRIHIKDNRIMF